MAEPGSKDAAGRSEIMALHCNFTKHEGRPCACRVEVGWLTNCSHLLCTEHAKEWFASNVECPVCHSGGPVRLLKVDFRKPRRERNLAMVGFLPSQVFQAASEAFEFWAQQKMLEHDWQEEAGARLRTRGARLKDACEERVAEVEQVISVLTDRKQELQERLHGAVEKGGKLEAEAKEVRRKLERVKRCCDALQATDDGWRAASAWRTRGASAGKAGQGVARDTPGGAPQPAQSPASVGRPGGFSSSATAFGGASLFGRGTSALGLGAGFSGSASSAGVAWRGMATPAGFCGATGLGKRRKIT